MSSRVFWGPSLALPGPVFWFESPAVMHRTRAISMKTDPMISVFQDGWRGVFVDMSTLWCVTRRCMTRVCESLSSLLMELNICHV